MSDNAQNNGFKNRKLYTVTQNVKEHKVASVLLASGAERHAFTTQDSLVNERQPPVEVLETYTEEKIHIHIHSNLNAVISVVAVSSQMIWFRLPNYKIKAFTLLSCFSSK